MNIIASDILPDVLEIKLSKHTDHRGCFCRVFCQKSIKELGVDFIPKQISNSYNKKVGTLRGLHFQKPPYEEDKIVSCISGMIFDVVVDLRPNSATFGKWVCFTLSSDNNTQIFIPKGFAHGFQTLRKNTIVNYMISENYHPNYASGVFWADDYLKIDWPQFTGKRSISEKDNNLPPFEKQNFEFFK